MLTVSQLKKINKTTPFIITTQRIKYIRINLTEKVNLKTIRHIMKEIEENKNKWKGTPHSWMRRISIVKMSILPNKNYYMINYPTSEYLSEKLTQKH